jgi:hypothetical protein
MNHKKVMQIQIGGGAINLVGSGRDVLQFRQKLRDKDNWNEFIEVPSELLGTFEFMDIQPSRISFITVKDYNMAVGQQNILVPAAGGAN